VDCRCSRLFGSHSCWCYVLPSSQCSGSRNCWCHVLPCSQCFGSSSCRCRVLRSGRFFGLHNGWCHVMQSSQRFGLRSCRRHDLRSGRCFGPPRSRGCRGAERPAAQQPLRQHYLTAPDVSKPAHALRSFRSRLGYELESLARVKAPSTTRRVEVFDCSRGGKYGKTLAGQETTRPETMRIDR
jgi:hypothetical protein